MRSAVLLLLFSISSVLAATVEYGELGSLSFLPSDFDCETAALAPELFERSCMAAGRNGNYTTLVGLVKQCTELQLQPAQAIELLKIVSEHGSREHNAIYALVLGVLMKETDCVYADGDIGDFAKIGSTVFCLPPVGPQDWVAFHEFLSNDDRPAVPLPNTNHLPSYLEFLMAEHQVKQFNKLVAYPSHLPLATPSAPMEPSVFFPTTVQLKDHNTVHALVFAVNYSLWNAFRAILANFPDAEGMAKDGQVQTAFAAKAVHSPIDPAEAAFLSEHYADLLALYAEKLEWVLTSSLPELKSARIATKNRTLLNSLTAPKPSGDDQEKDLLDELKTDTNALIAWLEDKIDHPDSPSTKNLIQRLVDSGNPLPVEDRIKQLMEKVCDERPEMVGEICISGYCDAVIEDIFTFEPDTLTPGQLKTMSEVHCFKTPDSDKLAKAIEKIFQGHVMNPDVVYKLVLNWIFEGLDLTKEIADPANIGPLLEVVYQWSEEFKKENDAHVANTRLCEVVGRVKKDVEITTLAEFSRILATAVMQDRQNGNCSAAELCAGRNCGLDNTTLPVLCDWLRNPGTVLVPPGIPAASHISKAMQTYAQEEIKDEAALVLFVCNAEEAGIRFSDSSAQSIADQLVELRPKEDTGNGGTAGGGANAAIIAELSHDPFKIPDWLRERAKDKDVALTKDVVASLALSGVELAGGPKTAAMMAEVCQDFPLLRDAICISGFCGKVVDAAFRLDDSRDLAGQLDDMLKIRCFGKPDLEEIAQKIKNLELAGLGVPQQQAVDRAYNGLSKWAIVNPESLGTITGDSVVSKVLSIANGEKRKNPTLDSAILCQMPANVNSTIHLSTLDGFKQIVASSLASSALYPNCTVADLCALGNADCGLLAGGSIKSEICDWVTKKGQPVPVSGFAGNSITDYLTVKATSAMTAYPALKSLLCAAEAAGFAFSQANLDAIKKRLETLKKP